MSAMRRWMTVGGLWLLAACGGGTDVEGTDDGPVSVDAQDELRTAPVRLAHKWHSEGHRYAESIWLNPNGTFTGLLNLRVFDAECATGSDCLGSATGKWSATDSELKLVIRDLPLVSTPLELPATAVFPYEVKEGRLLLGKGSQQQSFSDAGSTVRGPDGRKENCFNDRNGRRVCSR